MFVRAYLRASTDAQDATRATAAIDAFAKKQGLRIAARYVENESGATLQRPELFRLLADCQPGDVLLIEQVDRLSRLTETDWRQLRAAIDAKQVRIAALDLPTSWGLAQAADEFTGRMLGAVNGMLLDMLAAVARKDYDDRRRRQAEGISKALKAGRYKGRQEDQKRNAGIATMLRAGSTWQEVQDAFQCSRGTVAKIRKRIDAAAEVTAVPAAERSADRPQLDAATRKTAQAFLARIKDKYAPVDALIYGSRARGDHRPNSDADLAVILKGRSGDRSAVLHDLSGIAFDVMLETGILIHPFPLYAAELKRPQSYSNPKLIENIKREGLRP